MKRFSLGRSMLGGAAVATLLSGCGGSNGPPVMPSQRGPAAPKATRDDLLYVANQGAAQGVSILALPKGTRVGRITNIGAPEGICSDASGNVWIATYAVHSRTFHLYKFAHGGEKPVETLRVSKGALGCAIDPATGDLATWVAFAGSAGEVVVFPATRRKEPLVYETDFEPVAGTYDDRGNFFADGIVNSGDFIFEEKAKGSASFTVIRLTKPAINAGSVQWDGKYVVVGVGFLSDGPKLYRVAVSGNRGRVVQSVGLRALASPARFWIQDGRVVAGKGSYSVRRIGLYAYPEGGKTLDVFSGFYNDRGMTISVPPK